MTRVILKVLRPLLLIVLVLGLTGCTSFGKKLKAFLNKDQAEAQVQEQAVAAPRLGTMYSETQNYVQAPKRNYQRMTKEDFERGSQLASEAGSLWIMEGQGSYLFSQNIIRMVGDPISVKIEGDPKDQLESKMQVIDKLLKKLEVRRLAMARQLASQRKATVAGQVANGTQQQPEAGPEPTPDADPAGGGQEKDAEFKVKFVPARITERMIDGNYRIKGSQPFLIGKKEYMAIVTGILRPEDFSEDGISAKKLIDPRFDIVSSRGKESTL